MALKASWHRFHAQQVACGLSDRRATLVCDREERHDGPALVRVAVTVLLALGTFSCDDGPPPSAPSTDSPEPPAVAEVLVRPDTGVLEVGESLQFEAEAKDSQGATITAVEFDWSTSDTTVAVVGEDGLLEGLRAGRVKVSATAEDVTGEAAAAVQRPLEGPNQLEGKVFFGYQGWFACPGDPIPLFIGDEEAQWAAWFAWDRPPTAEWASIDSWPDVSELDADERCTTDMRLPDGSPAVVFSSQRRKTVERHFRWMAEYRLDGVALQRFRLDQGDVAEERTGDNRVARLVRDAAELHGRLFFVMYDVGNSPSEGLLEFIKRDWAFMVDAIGITDSPSYVRQGGKPVLGIWGLGLEGEPGEPVASPEAARSVIRYLKEEAPERYQAVLFGGVSEGWRELEGSSATDPAWADVYRSFDVISPWMVVRFNDEASADRFSREVVRPDIQETHEEGILYAPVVWPGFSMHNQDRIMGHPDAPFNEIPRDGGRFYWRQVYNYVSAGADMLYVAMYDEMNEGTAMFKLAPTRDDVPDEGKFLHLGIDGYELPSDWYLQLGRETGRVLRGEIPLSPAMPIEP